MHFFFSVFNYKNSLFISGAESPRTNCAFPSSDPPPHPPSPPPPGESARSPGYADSSGFLINASPCGVAWPVDDAGAE